MKTVAITFDEDDKPNISENDVYKIVNYWYLNLEKNIFQDENGRDLEEVVEPLIS